MKSYLVASTLAAAVAATTVGPYSQCGGRYHTGGTVCENNWVCTYMDEYYSQCLPPSSTTSASPSSTTSASCSEATSGGSGVLKIAGTNIAGCDFGCTIDGACVTGGALVPLLQYSSVDGAAQMQQFFSRGMNTFRLPAGWQFLTPTLGGTLDPTNWAKYDTLMQTCLNTGAYCIIDIHNYGRWNGDIIGQSGGAVTNAHFVSLWTQIATFYASEPRIAFGLMNEPHDLLDVNVWADTVQEVVTAIRNAETVRHRIFMPGNDWTSAEDFIKNGSADALSKVKNPDGSITDLYFDVHKYLDEDNSGGHVECVTDNIESSFLPLARWLRCHGRQAVVTETGGGNVQSCVTHMCAQLSFLKHNSDVFLGYTGWAAGAFPHTYELSEVPIGTQDTLLVANCLYQQNLP